MVCWQTLPKALDMLTLKDEGGCRSHRRELGPSWLHSRGSTVPPFAPLPSQHMRCTLDHTIRQETKMSLFAPLPFVTYKPAKSGAASGCFQEAHFWPLTWKHANQWQPITSTKHDLGSVGCSRHLSHPYSAGSTPCALRSGRPVALQQRLMVSSSTLYLCIRSMPAT